MDPRLEKLKELAKLEYSLDVNQAREMITLISNYTRDHLLSSGIDPRAVRAILTKFRDAGRRSPPWRPASSRVPGRPQDGADGNRRLRWLFDNTHKFYADEITATLTEVRYFLQLLSMINAPVLPENSIQDSFTWLTGHRILPGAYLDPIQLVSIDLNVIASDLRQIQSGHLVPLDRGGKHEPKNAFLLLSRSNQLQGNLKLDELLDVMKSIYSRHEQLQGMKKLTEEITKEAKKEQNKKS